MIHSKLIPNGQFDDAFDFETTDDLELASMEQTHSDIFLEINQPGIYKADALVTKERDLTLVVKTADCMPILVSDEEKIGVIHIGWKGLENNIFYKTISKFNLSKLKISIGPHAQKCCYEVKKDLETKFKKHCFRSNNKIYLNLSNEIENFCEENDIDLEIIDKCTIGDEKYNSYRRDNTKNRQWSYLWI